MLGTRNKMRFAALLFLCLGLASATAQARSNSPALPVSTNWSMNSVSFKFATPVNTKVTLDLGIDTKYGLTMKDASKKAHRITVPSLTPGHPYCWRIKAVPAKGTPMMAARCETTLPPATATLSIANGHFLLNGVRFFPMVTLAGACLDGGFVDRSTFMGGTVFQNPSGCGDSTGWSTEFDGLLKSKGWFFETNPQRAQALSGTPELLNWPSSGVNYLDNPLSLVGCEDSLSSSAPLYQASSAASRKGPMLFGLTLVDRGTPGGPQFCLNGPGTRNLFFANVIAHAWGLRLLTFIPRTGEISVKTEVSNAMHTASECMAIVGPATLNGRSVPATSSNPSVKLAAWNYGGGSYIIAVNTEKSAANTVLSVPGLKNISAQTVCDKQRSLKVTKGAMTVQLGALEVGIFKSFPK